MERMHMSDVSMSGSTGSRFPDVRVGHGYGYGYGNGYGYGKKRSRKGRAELT